MNTEHDLLCDILIHISEVSENLEQVISELRKRGLAHDRSKLQDPEFTAFLKTSARFKKANYGTKEYQECVDEIKPAIDHHHSHNRHHTSFHKDGINGMNLIDIMEMIADWKAASRRNPTRTFMETLPDAYAKYGIDKQLQTIITNTLIDLDWI